MVPTLVGVLLVSLPGLAIIWAGWGLRRPAEVLLIPAVSVAVLGLSAALAPAVGMSWSLFPVSVVTLLIAAVAFAVGRAGRHERRPFSRSLYLAAGLSLVAAAGLLLGQFLFAFVDASSIAQRFDNIVHLNSVRYALDTGSASPFHIGDTSDIGFYPNGWHALASLIASLTGADVTVAVNAANLVIVALIWPASTMAFSGTYFRGRSAAFVVAAALSTAFAAFPALFFDWGVLYPNALGYAVLPATLALVVVQFEENALPRRVLGALLLAFVCAGMTLAHPNALLAALLFGALLAIGLSVQRSSLSASASAWWWTAGIAAILAAAIAALWAYARTPAIHSPWPPYQNFPQAIGSGLLISPRGFVPTALVALLLIAGVIALSRRPKLIPIGLPFAAAILLFALVSGTAVDNPLRVALTNPWYSDSNRLAALLPIAGIPVLVAGALWILDAAAPSLRRGSRSLPRRIRPWARAAAAALATVLVFSIAAGSSVVDGLRGVRAAYTATEDSLLSVAERALIDRLDDHVPEGAVIIGSPRTGTSLAYALADRRVTEMHIFGSPGDDELYLDAHLREIERNPEVCAAIDRLGVGYVLDFGTRDVSGDDDPRGYRGVVNLEPSEHLVLVDHEGDEARLFEIEGC